MGFLIIHYFGIENTLRLLILAGCAIPLILSREPAHCSGRPVLARPHARVMASAVLLVSPRCRVSREGR